MLQNYLAFIYDFRIKYDKFYDFRVNKSSQFSSIILNFNHIKIQQQLQKVIEISYKTMKVQKRVPTTNSNKTNKTLSKPAKQNSIQLPKINKSNYDTNSNPSNYQNDFDNFQGNKDHGIIMQKNESQVSGLVNYNQMTMEEIKREYQRLRQQVQSLYTAVKKAKITMQSRILKKPIPSSNNSQKIINNLDDEIYNNKFLLQKLRIQVQNLEKRSNLANSNISKPNISLNDRILQSKQKIFQMKEKIKLLKRKTKKTGNDIVNVDQFQDDLTKLQKEEYTYLTKQSKLESKSEEVNYKLQKSIQKLIQIEEDYKRAEEFHKQFNLQQVGEFEEKQLFNVYRQKQYILQILSKKVQSSQQTNLQNYHQLLKNLEEQNHLLQKLQTKVINADMKVLRCKQNALQLEQTLQEVTKIYQQVLAQEKQNLQKQSTFLTAQYNVLGIKSIIQENQSELRQEQNQEKKKILFTKLEKLPFRRQPSTTKNVNANKNTENQGKSYFLSAKQIKQKRDAHRSSVISQNSRKVSANRTNIETFVSNKVSQEQTNPVKIRMNSSLKKQSTNRKPYMKIQSKKQNPPRQSKIQIPKIQKLQIQEKMNQISQIRKLQLQIETQLRLNRQMDLRTELQKNKDINNQKQEKTDLEALKLQQKRNQLTEMNIKKISNEEQVLDQSLQLKHQLKVERLNQKQQKLNEVKGQNFKQKLLENISNQQVHENLQTKEKSEAQIKLLTNESQKQSKIKQLDELDQNNGFSQSQQNELQSSSQIKQEVLKNQNINNKTQEQILSQNEQQDKKIQMQMQKLKQSYHIQKDEKNGFDNNTNINSQFGDFKLRAQ